MIQMTLDTPQGQREAEALRKFRELRRELLYLRYGQDWRAHERPSPAIPDEPDEAEKQMLERIGRFAEGAE